LKRSLTLWFKQVYSFNGTAKKYPQTYLYTDRLGGVFLLAALAGFILISNKW
jgi:hypothetical protein